MPQEFKWLNAALAVQRFCVEREWPFAFIGGVAVQRWGEPRVTQDVERVIVRQTGRLDWPYVLRQLRPLAELKEAPELMTRLEECRRRSETA